MRIDPTLYRGRPAQKRSEVEEACYDLLDGLGVSYERADHEHGDTIEALREVEKLLGRGICKNPLLTKRPMTQLYLLIMPGDKPFRTRELSSQIGSSRLSFGDEETMARLLDLHPGSVSVLGLMNDHDHRVRLLIDEDVLEEEQFGCHPCMNTSSIRFATKDLVDKILPAIGVGYTTVKLVGY